jgi:hypothetical protein
MTRYAIEMVMGSWVGSLIAYFFLIVPSGLFEQPPQQGVQEPLELSEPMDVNALDLPAICPGLAGLEAELEVQAARLAQAQAAREGR